MTPGCDTVPGVKGLYSKRGIWYLATRQEEGRKRRRISLRTKDYGEAVQRALAILEKEECERFLGGGAWDDAVTIYLAHKADQRRHRSASAHNAKVILELMGNELGKPRPSIVTRATVERLVKTLNERDHQRKTKAKLSSATVASYLRVLKAFFSWLVERGDLAAHPMKGMTMPRTRKTRRTDFFSPEERDLVMSRCERDDLKLILMLGFYTGMRFVEMLAMQWDWIWMGARRSVVTIQETSYYMPKSKESRDIPLHPMVVDFLKGYRERISGQKGVPKNLKTAFVLKPENRIWKNAPGYRYDPKKAMISLFDSCGLKWTGYHKLRHSFATQLILEDVTLSEVASLLGDELLVVQNHYAGFLPGKHDSVMKLRAPMPEISGTDLGKVLRPGDEKEG